MEIDSTELEIEIEKVLSAAATGKGSQPGCLTAYQILRRLPEQLRIALLDKHGAPGKGASQHYSAGSRVAKGASTRFFFAYLDARDLRFEFAPDEESAEGGYPLVALYRVPSAG